MAISIVHVSRARAEEAVRLRARSTDKASPSVSPLTSERVAMETDPCFSRDKNPTSQTGPGNQQSVSSCVAAEGVSSAIRMQKGVAMETGNSSWASVVAMANTDNTSDQRCASEIECPGNRFRLTFEKDSKVCQDFHDLSEKTIIFHALPQTSLPVYLQALEERVPREAIKGIGRSKRGISVLFINSADCKLVVKQGISINNQILYPAYASERPITVTLSPVPLEVPDSALIALLSQFSRVVGPVHRVIEAPQSSNYCHVGGLKRTLRVIFPNESALQTCPKEVEIVLDSHSFIFNIYTGIFCYVCNERGHIRAKCPYVHRPPLRKSLSDSYEERITVAEDRSDIAHGGTHVVDLVSPVTETCETRVVDPVEPIEKTLIEMPTSLDPGTQTTDNIGILGIANLRECSVALQNLAENSGPASSFKRPCTDQSGDQFKRSRVSGCAKPEFMSNMKLCYILDSEWEEEGNRPARYRLLLELLSTCPDYDDSFDILEMRDFFVPNKHKCPLTSKFYADYSYKLNAIVRQLNVMLNWIITKNPVPELLDTYYEVYYKRIEDVKAYIKKHNVVDRVF